MRKVLSMLLGVLIFTSTLSFAEGFSDMKGHWAEEYVDSLVSEGVLNGYFDGTFRPDNPITREETAKMVDVYFGDLLQSKGYSTTFHDVFSDRWSAKHIARLADAGIINGYGDGYYRPDNNMVRGDVSKVIYASLDNVGRYEDKGISVELSDISNHWAEEYIKKLVAMGVISGYGDGTFRPQNNITRAEMAKLLYSLEIPYADRNKEEPEEPEEPEEFRVTAKMLPEAYGVKIDDSEITKENLESKILEGVEATDQDGNPVKSMKLKAEDLEKFDKSKEGIYPVTVIFEDEKGRTAEKKVDVIVAYYGYEKFDPKHLAIINSYESGLSILAIPREVDGRKVVGIDDELFENASGIKKMYISRNCETGLNSFKGSSIETVIFEEGYKPTGTGRGVFSSMKNLQKVVLPDGLEEIGPWAFLDSTSLKEIRIPSSVKKIDSAAFSRTGLEKVRFASGSNLEEISEAAFMDTKLTEVVIPKNVKTIGLGAFRDTKITKLEFERNSQIHKIKQYAFLNTEIKKAEIPKSLKEVELYGAGEIINITQDDEGLAKVNEYCFGNSAELSWMD